ncbi:DUF7344 domain-containing protein [Halogeometricum limi]|uniref:DUF7344 domain-containing protein n=1 Tax=Halogeometricum limi TaxID=555875 RepID=A0A1I6FQY5_9EURY|nr:hypothetical protein [Halogeometricum limi]SFR32362.1 hypothetical protein SAMN04488124_0108 [Halogeometricum limi]
MVDNIAFSSPADEKAYELDVESDGRLVDALSEGCRRHVLTYLRGRRDPVELDALARQVAAWRYDADDESVTEEQQRRELVRLHHVHLPKLEAAALVRRRGGGVVATFQRSDVGEECAERLGHDDHYPEARLDGLFEVLSNPIRMKLVVAFQAELEAETPYTVAELADAVSAVDSKSGRHAGRSDRPADESERIAVALRHVHLPKMADVGVVSYDPNGETAVYEGHPALWTESESPRPDVVVRNCTQCGGMREHEVETAREDRHDARGQRHRELRCLYCQHVSERILA